MKIGILSGNKDQYDYWLNDHVHASELSNYFYVSSVVDLFEKRDVDVQRVDGWRTRRDLYEIYDYIAHDGGLNDIVLDGRYLNDYNIVEALSDDISIPIGSYVRDECIFFKSVQDNSIIGTLTWKNGYLQFYGKSKDSAEAFFEDIKWLAEDLIENKYIKRTPTIGEYMDNEKEKEHNLDLLGEYIDERLKMFVKENNLSHLEDKLDRVVGEIVQETADVFTMLDEIDNNSF